MQNVAESSLFGGGRLQAVRGKAIDIAGKAVERFTDNLAPNLSREETGTLVQDLIEGGAAAFKAVARGGFKQVDNLLVSGTAASAKQGGPGVVPRIVDITEAKKIASDALTRRGLKQPETERIARQILDRPDKVTFAEAQELRSDLLLVSRTIQELIPGQAKTLSRRTSPLIDSAMSQAAKQLNPQALVVWRTANRFWKKGIEDFNSRFVKTLLNKDPELVVDTFARRGAVNPVRRVRNLVNKTDPDAWPAVQQQFVTGLIQKASTTGELSGRTLSRQIRAFGNDTLKELFPNAVTRNRFRLLARTLEITQAKAGAEGIGRVAIQLMQPGAVGGMVAGLAAGNTGVIIGSGTILFTPQVLSAVLSSPAASGWLIKGIQVSPGSKEFINAMSKLLAAATKEGILPPERRTEQ
ncbi:MAG: hypothetical protein ACR2RF_25435 [Geminicoccaceae bacterium]